MKFKVGQRVQCLLSYSRNRVSTGSKFATVRLTRVYGLTPCLEVDWEDPKVAAAFEGAGDNDGGLWGEGHFILAPVLFTLDKAVTTRAGAPVSVDRTDDPQRPYCVTHRLADRDLVLTYDPEGRFYPGLDQPHDLVNP